MPYRKYFEILEKIFLEYGGRPHWGKMNTHTAKDFDAMYPKWEEFNTIRNQMDPDGVFLNNYLQNIFANNATS